MDFSSSLRNFTCLWGDLAECTQQIPGAAPLKSLSGTAVQVAHHCRTEWNLKLFTARETEVRIQRCLWGHALHGLYAAQPRSEGTDISLQKPVLCKSQQTVIWWCQQIVALSAVLGSPPSCGGSCFQVKWYWLPWVCAAQGQTLQSVCLVVQLEGTEGKKCGQRALGKDQGIGNKTFCSLATALHMCGLWKEQFP